MLLSFFIVWLCINLVCSIPDAALKFPRENAGKVSQKCHSACVIQRTTGNLNEKRAYPQEKILWIGSFLISYCNLPQLPEYSESELESRIIDHLQQFLLELGTGFAFMGQVRFTFDEEHFIVDLVFYNRLLRCFVLFDLKIGELKHHQDIGQMQMYVHYYDRKVKLPEENPTIGIILCKDKNNAVVEMTLPEDNTQIFASKYETVLPSKEELQKLLEEQLAE